MDNLRADAMSEADSESINWNSITGTSTFLSFDSYDIDCENKCIKFSFSYGDSLSSFVFSQFFTYLYIESSVPTEHSLKSSAAEKAAFNIGMATIPWLWMGLVTNKVVIRAADLCDEQLEYWRKCFRGVLAEFLFVNRLDIASLPDLEVQYHPPNSHLPEPSFHHENLLTLSEKLPTHSDMQNGEFSPCQPVLGTKPQSASPSQPDGESDTTFCTSLASTPRVLVPLGAGRYSLTVYEMVKKR